MGRSNGRTVPFPGFSRGIPIIGQPQEDAPPPGLYYYQIPALIQRAGHSLEADTFECRFPLPLSGVGVHFIATAKEIQARLAADRPELPEPKVILLSPIFLGFVPQAVLDRMEAAGIQAEGAAPANVEGQEEPKC